MSWMHILSEHVWFSGMQGGKAAAETAISMRATGDYSAASTSQYEHKWNHLYGYDFGKVSSASLLAIAAPK